LKHLGGIGIKRYTGISSIIMVVMLVVFSQTTVFASNDAHISDNSNTQIITEKYSSIVPANLVPIGLKINQSYYNASLNAYVDPVFTQVNDMRAKGFTDDSIVAELKKQDITFDPKTDSWAKGTPVTPPVPIVNPYNKSAVQNEMSTLSDTRDQINSYHNTQNYVYCGFSNTMYPGDMELMGDGYTHTDYVTTHIGNGPHWAEAGLAHWSSGYFIFTYDNLFDGDDWYTISISPGIAHTTSILISNVWNQQHNGFLYQVTLDGNYIRSGWLSSSAFRVTQNNEIFKDATAPSFTNNAYHNWVYNQHLYLYNVLGTLVDTLWSNSVPTDNGDGGYPSHQTITTDSWGTAQVETWVHY
jgi:hypothetical protein